MWKCHRVKYPLFLPEFNETLIFSTDFQKNSQLPSFIKIRLMGAELFYAYEQKNGRADGHAEGNSRFPKFCEGAQLNLR
jgi:hypothetical protein